MAEIGSTPPWIYSGEDEFEEFYDRLDDELENLVELEREYGALVYAHMANRAADILNYPRSVKTDVPDEAEDAIDQFLDDIMPSESEDVAHALYGMAADASLLRTEYTEEYGKENFEPLAKHISRIETQVEMSRRMNDS